MTIKNDRKEVSIEEIMTLPEDFDVIWTSEIPMEVASSEDRICNCWEVFVVEKGSLRVACDKCSSDFRYDLEQLLSSQILEEHSLFF